MTSVNVILQKDRVTVITDTAFYDTGGYVQGFAPKAMMIPHWPGIIAMRGPIFVHALLVAKLSLRFSDIDAFADEARSFLSDFCEEHDEMLRSNGIAPGIQVTAAGLSPNGTCRAFTIQAGEMGELTSGGAEGDGIEHADLNAGDIVEVPMGQAFVLPLPSAEEMNAAGVNLEVDIARLDLAGVRRFGTQVLRAQRQVCDVLSPGEEPTYAVGGQPVFLTVSRDGSTTTCTGPAWPDEIGERINPDSEQVNATNRAEAATAGASLSRQQRRELARRERQAAKRAAA